MWNIEYIKIGNILVFGFLVGCTYIDIKRKEIPVWLLLYGTVVILILSVLHWQQVSVPWILGAGIGAGFFLLSKVTKESLGYGDSWMICLLGIYLGAWKLLIILCIAFPLVALVAAVKLFGRKWSKQFIIPFFPFLTIGYIGGMIL